MATTPTDPATPGLDVADIAVPSGRERQVEFLGSVSIGGAPVAYIVVLSAVVTTLSFVPFSIVLSSGGSFPISQGIYALLGWVLGPVAGAAAAGIGALIGAFFAPHTAGLWPLSVTGAALAAFAAGCFRKPSRIGRLGVVVFGAASLVLYLGRARFVNGISPSAVIWSSAVDWSAFLLFLSPLRGQVVRWLADPRLGRVALGLYCGTYIAFGIAHAYTAAVSYYLFNWPEPVWVLLIPIIPIEMALRCAIAAVIGTGVISGLRAIGLLRPKQAAY